MEKKYSIILLLLLIVTCWKGNTMGQCRGQKLSTYYYGGFTGYSQPLEPVEKLTKEKALSQKSYCIGYYDTTGRLIRFEKYLNKKLFFSFDYIYYSNGKIKESKGLNADGKRSVLRFNPKGKLIK